MNIQPQVKKFIESYITLINENKFDELFEAAVIEAELSEYNFNNLCQVLSESGIYVQSYREAFFTNLFSQYVEENESDYEQNDSDRLVEMMDTMSTAGCLGLDYKDIVYLIKQWSLANPGIIEVHNPGHSLDTLRIRFLRGDSN